MANLFDNVLGNSIENLKSSIVKHGGVAQENRFAIYMSPPKQTLFNFDLNAIITNAISGGKFNAASLINDPRDMAILCESCTLPGRQILTADYQSVKQSVKVPYGFINEDVTFTFLLTNDYYIKKIFDRWSDQILNYNTYRASYMKDYVTDVTIVQLNKKNLPVYKVILHNAYPITFNPITLDNNAENTAQKFSVTLTYENFFVDRVPAETNPISKFNFGVEIGQITDVDTGVPIANAPGVDSKVDVIRTAPDVYSDAPIISKDKYGLSNLSAYQNNIPR
jgi:hypothetical protein